MADTKLTALTEVSVPLLTDIAYWVADPGGTPASDKISGTRLGGLFVVAQCQGRLTTESGVPISTSDRTSQGTLYWTPCTPGGVAIASGLVGFYDGTRYVVKSLTELSLAMTVTSGKNYDVFLDYNSGTPQLALSAAWTNDSTRADALATQGPIIVKSGSTSLRWVGTIRASGTNTIEQSLTHQFVWNAYNPVSLVAEKLGTTSHTYSTSADRNWNNSSTETACDFILGAAAYVLGQLEGRQGNDVGAGCNSVTSLKVDGASYTAQIIQVYQATIGAIATCAVSETLRLAAGYHTGIVIENGEGQSGSKFFEGKSQFRYLG